MVSCELCDLNRKAERLCSICYLFSSRIDSERNDVISSAYSFFLPLKDTFSLGNHKLFVTKFTVVICEVTGQKGGTLLAAVYVTNFRPETDQFVKSWCVSAVVRKET
jgi:hypothetical protein